LLRNHFGKLNPTELKIALHLWLIIAGNGGEPVDLSIRELALATGLSWKAVQKYRNTLQKKGAFQLLSTGRERSRYALPSGIELQQTQVEVSACQTAAPLAVISPNEDIARLVTQITGLPADESVMRSAEQTAGGKPELLSCLRIICRTYRRKPSTRSLLTLIALLRYQLALGERIHPY
jgi:hypothetical protein